MNKVVRFLILVVFSFTLISCDSQRRSSIAGFNSSADGDSLLFSTDPSGDGMFNDNDERFNPETRGDFFQIGNNENTCEKLVQSEECLTIMNTGIVEILRIYDDPCDILESSELENLFAELAENCCSTSYQELITTDLKENCNEESVDVCRPGSCDSVCESPKACSMVEGKECQCVCPDINQMSAEEKYDLIDSCKYRVGNLEYTEELCINHVSVAQDFFECCPEDLDYYIARIKEECLALDLL